MKVRCIRTHSNQITAGCIYEVEREFGNYYKIIDDTYSKRDYLKRSFEPIPEPHQDYTFNVSGDSAVDFNRIYNESCSKENPIVTVTSTLSTVVHILVHESVIFKGLRCVYLNLDAYRLIHTFEYEPVGAGGRHLTLSYKYIGPIVDAVRSIRDAKWTGNKATIKVHKVNLR